MTTLVDRFLIRFGLLPQPLESAQTSEWAVVRRIEDMSNIPRYPPFMEGLPVHSPAALLATQQELTDGVRQLIANPELLNAHYNPAMLRLAEFVQLLPASQSHHHRGAGGMLRHSLEVGLWALQQTEGKLIRGVITPQQRRVIEPRWRLAAFLAGACHDLGKVVTDLSVTDRGGEQKWRPYKHGLYEWAMAGKIDSYFLHWTEGRGKNHTNVSSTLIDAVISKESFDWIGQGSTDAVIWLTESLNNNPGSSNQIHNFVVRADQLSVERDLKSMGAAMAGYEIGVPIERYLTDIMRRLVQEGIWRINEPSARVWNIGGTTYLVWPMAGEEIARRTRDEDIAGLPKTPDGILDMMIEREIAFLREGDSGDSFFYIAPDVVTEKIPNMRLKSIRLRDQALISSMPLSPIAGKVYSNKTDTHGNASTAVAHQVEDLTNTNENPQVVPSTSANHVNEPTPTVTRHHHVPSTSAVCVNDMRDETPQLPLVSVETAGVTEPPRTPQTAPAETNVCFTPLSLESLDGAIGELLRVLIKEFKSGQKSFSELGIKLPDGCIYLKWPDTFAGYGFTPKQILSDLSEMGWLIPASEVAAIGDAQFAGGTAKALWLTSDVGSLFSFDSEPGKSNSTPEAQGSQPIHFPLENSTSASTETSLSETSIKSQPTKTRKKKSATQKSKPKKNMPSESVSARTTSCFSPSGAKQSVYFRRNNKGKSIEKAC